MQLKRFGESDHSVCHTAILDCGLIPLGGLLSLILGGLLVAVATFCQLLGGVSLLLGYKVEIGVFLLIIFFIPTMLLASPNFMGDGAQWNEGLVQSA